MVSYDLKNKTKNCSELFGIKCTTRSTSPIHQVTWTESFNLLSKYRSRSSTEIDFQSRLSHKRWCFELRVVFVNFPLCYAITNMTVVYKRKKVIAPAGHENDPSGISITFGVSFARPKAIFGASSITKGLHNGNIYIFFWHYN